MMRCGARSVTRTLVPSNGLVSFHWISYSPFLCSLARSLLRPALPPSAPSPSREAICRPKWLANLGNATLEYFLCSLACLRPVFRPAPAPASSKSVRPKRLGLQFRDKTPPKLFSMADSWEDLDTGDPCDTHFAMIDGFFIR